MISRGTIYKGWPHVELGKVVDFLDHLRKPVTAKDRVEGPYPYYGANGQQDSVNDYIFDEPLVLLAEDGGHFGDPEKTIAYQVEGKCWVNNHAHVLRPNERINIRFLCRHLENYDVRPYTSGTTRLKLNKGQASKIILALPPLDEQKRIAEVLDQAEALRAQRRAALALLDELTQSIFLDMFGDPVTNPNGYEQETLDKLTLNLTDGKHGDCKPAPNSGFYFVSVKDIKNGKIDYSKARQIDEQDFHEVHRRTRLEPEDVLITNSGTIGRTAIVPDVDETHRTTFQKSVAILKPKKERLDACYLKHVLDYCVANLQKNSSGSSQKNLLLSQLRAFKVYVPPMKQQQLFKTRIASVDFIRTKQGLMIERMDSLFQSLQHRAFRGDLFPVEALS